MSAGAVASPQLLMLSGIGPADHLKYHNIPVVVDLPVGYNLQSHVGVGELVFTVKEKVWLGPVSLNFYRAVILAVMSKLDGQRRGYIKFTYPSTMA